MRFDGGIRQVTTPLIPEDLANPKLRDGRWGFGSDRKNAEAWDLLPLGPKPFNYDAYKARQARRR